jgi:hypothetical protein
LAMFAHRFVAAIVLASACTAPVAQSQQSSCTDKEAQSFFIIASDAKNVACRKIAGDRRQLTYRVDAEHPAQKIIEGIKRNLGARGWTPMQQDYFNPGLANSLIRGWEYYEDRATKPTTSVQYWQVDWRRGREIVTYRLEYRCPDNLCASTRDLHDLQVIAIYAKDADKTYHQ